jgi:phosphoribosylformylglycinamidine cyclo-ligase
LDSYRDAGVDLDGAARHVSMISADVSATWGEGVVGGFGGFAAGVPLPRGFADPILMMSTDGVGTKLDLARRSGIWAGVGHDLVAMCVDDLAAVGARPIGFVDYMAVGSLRPERDAIIVGSVAEACSLAGCPLLGGETAEHPGIMEPDAVDLAGAAMGAVERQAILSPDKVSQEDLIIGLRSPNLRSNGFSLVRRVFGDDIDKHIPVLIEPSVIYSPSVLAAIAAGGVNAAAHITGGGLAENLGRALPPHLGARIESGAWDPPDVFDLVSTRGIDIENMFRVFNMGIGFCLIVDPPSQGRVLDAVSMHHPVVIGRIDTTPGVTVS